jgi:hypothetical protein
MERSGVVKLLIADLEYCFEPLRRRRSVRTSGAQISKTSEAL